MIIRFASETENGGREVNEDRVRITGEDSHVIAALADGLGGHGMGDIASETAVENAISIMKNGGSLEEAFDAAQEAVLVKQKALHAGNAMKTTLCLLRIREGICEAGHIGDSRIYFFVDKKLVFRTMDHSVPQMLVRAGEISEDQIRFHEDRNKVLRVIGTEWEEPEYEMEKPFELKKKGLFRKKRYEFLMCSDGWWELICEDRMQETLKASQNPAEWLLKMKQEIRNAGNTEEMDNYTAAAVFVEFE